MHPSEGDVLGWGAQAGDRAWAKELGGLATKLHISSGATLSSAIGAAICGYGSAAAPVPLAIKGVEIRDI